MLISQFNIVLWYANKINVWILQITTWISQKKNSATRYYLLIESQFLKMKWNNKLNPELGSTLNWKKKLPYYCCCLVGRSVDLETTFFLFFFFHTYLYFIWNYVFVPITRLSRQAFFGYCLETNQKVRLIWDEKYPLSSCLIVCYFEMI